jgi:hypothetical protein
MKAIFLSPHFDDAVFSCGGLIARLSQVCPTEVWTIFAGKPLIPRSSSLSRWLHLACNAPNAASLNAARKNEDLNAMKLLKSSSKHFRFLDCVYRIDWLFRPLYKQTCLTALHPTDEQFIQTLKNVFQRLIDPSDILFTPLGIGNHVDHQITRAAIESTKPSTLCYFEDVPYNIPEIAPKSTEPLNCNLIKIPLQFSDVESWKLATREYVSQLPVVDHTGKLLESYISGFQNKPFKLLGTTTATQKLTQLLPNT